MKMDGCVLDDKSSFNLLRVFLSSKFDSDSYVVSVAETLDESRSLDWL